MVGNMRFENIQTKEDLRNFFISRGFEIQKHDETLIKIDNLPHFLKIEYVDDFDFKKAERCFESRAEARCHSSLRHPLFKPDV